jgi:hypothetical protein
MGTGKRRINSAVRVLLIVLVAELEHAQVVAELEHDQVAAELEHDPVAAELEHDLVVEEPEHDLVEAVLELAPVAAVLAPNLLPGRLAVARKTKLVTAAHRPGRPLLAAEALAVEAETTREPAATEVAIAWVVAVTAVAAAGIVVAVG